MGQGNDITLAISPSAQTQPTQAQFDAIKLSVEK